MMKPLIAGCIALAAVVGAERASGAEGGDAKTATLYVSELALNKQPLRVQIAEVVKARAEAKVTAKPEDKSKPKENTKEVDKANDKTKGEAKSESKLNFFCTAGFKRLSVETDALLNTKEPPLQACDDDRLLIKKGDALEVVYVGVDAGDCPKATDIVLNVQEHARKTAAAAGFAAIVDFVITKASDAPAVTKAHESVPPPPQLCFVAGTYKLIYDRATADVAVSLKGTPDDKATKQIITGPIEHWFLSGDAVVKGVKELKYDKDQKAIFARDKPEQLYLGINWMNGDVYGKYSTVSMERAVLKLLLSPTRHPFDSFGLGVGYRFADFSSEGTLQPNGGFILFAGHFWSKNEQVDTSGVVNQGGRSRSWRVGVSYGLDSLLGWLK